ncbi:hypothetical protein GCM10009801_07250 [Streptomyces albiaxialis]|uniref:Transposase n=1 Tax=Streptomyces albiaxialis TaxID=329523 RepID=A0ABN2VIT2_9ACTN
MPKPYPEEFRQDVVRVARNRGPGVTLEQVAIESHPGPEARLVMSLGRFTTCLCCSHAGDDAIRH